MIQRSRELGAPTKHDGVSGGSSMDDKASAAAAPPTSNSRAWSTAFRNPRIVRVSRAFGGKDRHSKVRTIRGLRDRRVRLSVPTAIQLYDLQDKLGFNQPSKVVDWLLNAAQHEIDKLPPLEMLHLQGGDDQDQYLFQFPQSLVAATAAAAAAAAEHMEESNNYNNISAGQANYSCQRTAILKEDGLSRSDLLNIRGKAKQQGNLEQQQAGIGLENSTNGITFCTSAANPFFHHLETAPNAYSPVAILASYMAAASNVDARQYGYLQMARSSSSQEPSKQAPPQ